MARIAGIYRYPVKGLSAESLRSVELVAGEGLPRDRKFALADRGRRSIPNGRPGCPRRTS